MDNLNEERLEIIGRKRLQMTGVESVDGFSEESIKITVQGKRVSVFGEKIKITSFNKGTGNLSAEGVFSEVKYLGAKTPLIKRLFK